jgi:o-succinylbenzoate synthase
VALAAALPELPYASGLATVQLLEEDIVAEPLLPIDGFLPVRRVAPDAAKVDSARADVTAEQRWRKRLRAVA